MRRLAIAAAVILGLTGAAQADGYRGHGHHHYHGGGGDWAAPLIGGLIISGMLGAMSQPQPYYQQQYYYQPQVYCQWEDVYDYNGWYLGKRKRCWQQ